MLQRMRPADLSAAIARGEQIVGARQGRKLSDLDMQIKQAQLKKLQNPERLGAYQEIQPGLIGQPVEGQPNQWRNVQRVEVPKAPKDNRTTLQKNLEAAGYIPGMPGYADAMNKSLFKPRSSVTVNNQQGNPFGIDVPAGYMINPEYQQGQPQSADNPVIVPIIGGPKDPDVVNQRQFNEGMVKFDNIQSSLDRYENIFNQSGALLRPGAGKMKLNTAYKDLQLELKEMFNLGVLNGPDLQLIESYITDPTSISGNLYQAFGGRDGFNAQLNLARQKLNDARQAYRERFQPTQSAQPTQPSVQPSQPTIDFTKMSNEELEAFIRENQQ